MLKVLSLHFYKPHSLCWRYCPCNFTSPQSLSFYFKDLFWSKVHRVDEIWLKQVAAGASQSNGQRKVPWVCPPILHLVHPSPFFFLFIIRDKYEKLNGKWIGIHKICISQIFSEHFIVILNSNLKCLLLWNALQGKWDMMLWKIELMIWHLDRPLKP